jgi:hypothetical protein
MRKTSYGRVAARTREAPHEDTDRIGEADPDMLEMVL